MATQEIAHLFVQANVQTTDAMVEVKKGDRLHVHASAVWTINPQVPRECNAEGYRNAPADADGYPLKDYNVGCLCARIGKGSVFYVGVDRVFSANDSGELYFLPNDQPAGLKDNHGRLDVVVEQM